MQATTTCKEEQEYQMSLSKRQIAYLNKIVATAQKMLATAELESRKQEKSARGNSGKKTAGKRRRRSGVQVEKMRADILAKRAKGVAATKLAEKYGVSTAYIYMIK
jgi:hypothetical protein